MHVKNTLTRRNLLKHAALGGAGLVILRNSASAWSFQANESVGIGLVGVSGRGDAFVQLLENKGSGARPAALCDVDNQRAAAAYAKFPDVPKYQDFRVMLDKQKDIDAVIVPTPEFSRALILAAAMKAGKHVYGEKPLTREPYESRVLRELAMKSKLATQMGNQGSSRTRFQQAKALVQTGLLGDVTEIHVWGGGIEPTGDAPRKAKRVLSVPTTSQPVPEYLNWDVWLAGAAQRGYHEQWYGKRKWQQWRDFGSSGLGWGATHCAALPFMAMRIYELWDAADLAPDKRSIRVEATLPEVCRLGFPRWELVRYAIPARGKLPPLNFTWQQGTTHFLEKALGELPEWRDQRPKPWWQGGGGSAMVGSKGKLNAGHYGDGWSVYPAELAETDVVRNAGGSRGHEAQWLDACRGKGQTASDFRYSGPFNEMLTLGNVATLVGEPFTYDPVTGKVLDNDAAQAALHQEYRQGWSL